MNPADSEAIEGTVKIEIEEHPINEKPELDRKPTFDRHYVFLPEDPTMDIELHSAATSVHLKQESDPFTALPSVDTERENESVSGQSWNCSTVDLETATEESEDFRNTKMEQNIPSSTSNQPSAECTIKQTPSISADTNICHIEGDAAISRNDNDPEAGPSQNIDQLNQSLLHPRDVPFSCDVCTYKGTSSSNLAKHKKLHSSEKKFQCGQCDYKAHLKSSVVRHLRIHSGEQPYTCDICTFRCAQNWNLVRHKLRHTNEIEKKFQCSQCDYRAHLKSSLVCHLRIHSGEQPYACEICTYRSAHRKSLAQHKLSHSNEKMFQCSQCDYRTHQRSNLVLHERIHSGERPYACDICPYKCSSSSNLTQHKLRHSNEKKFQCSQCDYRTHRRNNLVEHERIHSGERPYACDVCEHKFTRRGHLTSHKRMHHGVKKFKCDICAYSFIWKSRLTKHKKAHVKSKTKAAALSCEFGPKRDFNSTTTDYNMQISDALSLKYKLKRVSVSLTRCDAVLSDHLPRLVRFADLPSTSRPRSRLENPADSQAIEGTVKIEIEEHPIEVKPKLDLMPTFDRHYVFLPEDPTMDVDLHSATTSVNVKQESDPFTALPSVDTEGGNGTVSRQMWNYGDYVVKSEQEECGDSQDIKNEQIITSPTSIHQIEEYLLEQKPKISADTNICHIEGDAAFSRNDNDPEAGPSQNTDPLNQSLLHPRDFPFSCDVCTYKGTSKYYLAQHKILHSSEKKFQCSQCDYRAHFKGNLVRHLSTHSGERSFTCHVCTYKSTSSHNLAQHRKLHSSEKKFQCCQCDFRTHQKNHLEENMRSHSGERPYACDICTYSSARKSGLANHKLRHSNEKKFQCSQCDFRAHRKDDLVVHLRIHSGEKPYACDVCEYKCKNVSALLHHKDFHSGVKNYKCDKCNYACVRSGDLTQHKKIHLKLKPYQCDKCAYSSVRKCTLTRHNKTHK